MCKYTTLSLSATRCTLLHAGAAAHVYTKYTYYLCHAAHANRPCGNQFPEEEQIGSDVGSRQGACPTCEQLSAAEAEYKLAVQRATDVYTDSVNLAWQRLQDGRGSADYVAEVYPYRHRRRY